MWLVRSFVLHTREKINLVLFSFSIFILVKLFLKRTRVFDLSKTTIIIKLL